MCSLREYISATPVFPAATLSALKICEGIGVITVPLLQATVPLLDVSGGATHQPGEQAACSGFVCASR